MQGSKTDHVDSFLLPWCPTRGARGQDSQVILSTGLDSILVDV
jgi:hypothetical protein